MTYIIRRQLTLFVEQKDAEQIELIRQEFNPRQFEIIKAHVTLCREDEILNLEKVKSNLFFLKQTGLNIEFGKIERFDNGKGLFLPATNNNEEFDDLRRQNVTTTHYDRTYFLLLEPITFYNARNGCYTLQRVENFSRDFITK